MCGRCRASILAGLTQLYRMRDAQLWRHIEFHPECNAIYAALD
ncbi:antirestriction protein [Escherichia coli]|nr:antirestriction protein [Escherichia coli]EHC2790061.1 antirestriction protein [Escherichia coli]